MAPASTRSLRFALPPSKGNRFVASAPQLLELLLERELPEYEPHVHSCADYAALTQEVMARASDLAWAPPLLCARVERAGGLVIGHFERRGLATYRGALVCSRAHPVTLGPASHGLRAAWIDHESTAGYLLPRAHLHKLGVDPARAFAKETFAKTFLAALEAVASGQADLTAVYATPAGVKEQRTGLDDLPMGVKDRLQIVGFTDEAPTDGLVVSPGGDAKEAVRLRDRLLAALRLPTEAYTLKQVFNADGLSPAAPHAYDALLRLSSRS